MYRVLEISWLWWLNFTSESWFSTSRKGFRVLERWFISHPDLSVRGKWIVMSVPHSRTWRWVFVSFSPWFLSNCENRIPTLSAIHRAAWCTRIQHGRLIRAQTSWHQTNRPRFWHRRLFSCPSFLSSLRHGVRLFNWKKTAARQHREIHNVEQTKKMIPLITFDITFRQHVSELVFGVNIWFGELILEHVSHRSTSALCDHFDHSLIVFKNVQLSFELRRICCDCDNVIHTRQFINFSVTVSCWSGVGVGALRARPLGTWSSTFSFRQWSLTAWWVFFEECNTSGHHIP